MTYADQRNAAARQRAMAQYRERMAEHALSGRRVVVIDATPIARADEAWAVRQAVDFMAGRRAA